MLSFDTADVARSGYMDRGKVTTDWVMVTLQLGALDFSGQNSLITLALDGRVITTLTENPEWYSGDSSFGPINQDRNGDSVIGCVARPARRRVALRPSGRAHVQRAFQGGYHPSRR